MNSALSGDIRRRIPNPPAPSQNFFLGPICANIMTLKGF